MGTCDIDKVDMFMCRLMRRLRNLFNQYVMRPLDASGSWHINPDVFLRNTFNVMPVSSKASRLAVSCRVSLGSTWPPGGTHFYAFYEKAIASCFEYNKNCRCELPLHVNPLITRFFILAWTGLKG